MAEIDGIRLLADFAQRGSREAFQALVGVDGWRSEHETGATPTASTEGGPSMKSTRTLLACFATGFALTQGQSVQSEPLPGAVVDILRLEKVVAARPGARLSLAEADKFLAEVRAETNRFVRAELLFQIGTRANKEQLEAARGALEQSEGGASSGFTESEAQFLDAISANPLKRATTPGLLKRVIESRLAQEQ